MKPLTVPPAITGLLGRWSAGDREAAEQVLPLVYDELRRIAARQLRRERGEHTLQATAIVTRPTCVSPSEHGLLLAEPRPLLRLAAHLIRRILVDYARRGGGPSAAATCGASSDRARGAGVTPRTPTWWPWTTR